MRAELLPALPAGRAPGRDRSTPRRATSASAAWSGGRSRFIGQRCAQAWHDRPLDRLSGRRQGLEDARVDRRTRSEGKVVLPQPGPAERNTTGTVAAPFMTSISASRDTARLGPAAGATSIRAAGRAVSRSPARHDAGRWITPDVSFLRRSSHGSDAVFARAGRGSSVPHDVARRILRRRRSGADRRRARRLRLAADDGAGRRPSPGRVARRRGRRLGRRSGLDGRASARRRVGGAPHRAGVARQAAAALETWHASSGASTWSWPRSSTDPSAGTARFIRSGRCGGGSTGQARRQQSANGGVRRCR